jgi:hypothetical protein
MDDRQQGVTCEISGRALLLKNQLSKSFGFQILRLQSLDYIH